MVKGEINGIGIYVKERCLHGHLTKECRWARKADCEICEATWIICKEECGNNDDGVCRLEEIEIGKDGECRCRTDV